MQIRPEYAMIVSNREPESLSATPENRVLWSQRAHRPHSQFWRLNQDIVQMSWVRVST